MDPAEFIAIGERLWNSHSEGERRTAIGRYYYGVFNRLCAVVAASGKPVPDTYAAHGCIRYYLQAVERRLKETAGASQTFSNLRTDRNDADYRMDVVLEPARSEVARRRAQRLIKMLDSVTEPRLAQAIGVVPTCRPSSDPFSAT